MMVYYMLMEMIYKWRETVLGKRDWQKQRAQRGESALRGVQIVYPLLQEGQQRIRVQLWECW